MDESSARLVEDCGCPTGAEEEEESEESEGEEEEALALVRICSAWSIDTPSSRDSSRAVMSCRSCVSVKPAE